ncbi:hypothetical protein [Streptomyces coffeae]|uniref:Transposase n=1 Tax=Streptomyces coffeae TaxID=621382 RepID=A0ABS1NN26_9ACTN|nr:hypothetical protein [Streptomyces coffeae]MBL1101493.1 hypothetical protein [Streptomyces coffeae]
MISVEDWVEIRRLHRAEQRTLRAVARRLEISQDVGTAVLKSEVAPKYQPKSLIVDVVEPHIRDLLRRFRRCPRQCRGTDWLESFLYGDPLASA